MRNRGFANALLMATNSNVSASHNPRRQNLPFVWPKSADEILETIAGYCERIPDSGRHVSRLQ